MSDGTTGEKECPACAEMVRERAAICRFCGYQFNGAPSRKSGGRARALSIALVISIAAVGLGTGVFIRYMLDEHHTRLGPSSVVNSAQASVVSSSQMPQLDSFAQPEGAKWTRQSVDANAAYYLDTAYVQKVEDTVVFNWMVHLVRPSNGSDRIVILRHATCSDHTIIDARSDHYLGEKLVTQEQEKPDKNVPEGSPDARGVDAACSQSGERAS